MFEQMYKYHEKSINFLHREKKHNKKRSGIVVIKWKNWKFRHKFACLNKGNHMKEINGIFHYKFYTLSNMLN